MTTIDIERRLEESTDRAQSSFRRLVLLVGPSGTGKTSLLRRFAKSSDSAYVNVNLGLSQRLLEHSRSRRPRQVDRIFIAMVDENQGELVVLDNLELLFDPALQLDPLRLLKAASRKRTLVAAWNGTFHDGVLSYAEPGHPEYRSYRDADVLVVSLSNETTTDY